MMNKKNLLEQVHFQIIGHLIAHSASPLFNIIIPSRLREARKQEVMRMRALIISSGVQSLCICLPAFLHSAGGTGSKDHQSVAHPVRFNVLWMTKAFYQLPPPPECTHTTMCQRNGGNHIRLNYLSSGSPLLSTSSSYDKTHPNCSVCFLLFLSERNRGVFNVGKLYETSYVCFGISSGFVGITHLNVGPPRIFGAS